VLDPELLKKSDSETKTFNISGVPTAYESSFHRKNDRKRKMLQMQKRKDQNNALLKLAGIVAGIAAVRYVVKKLK